MTSAEQHQSVNNPETIPESNPAIASHKKDCSLSGGSFWLADSTVKESPFNMGCCIFSNLCTAFTCLLVSGHVYCITLTIIILTGMCLLLILDAYVIA